MRTTKAHGNLCIRAISRACAVRSHYIGTRWSSRACAVRSHYIGTRGSSRACAVRSHYIGTRGSSRACAVRSHYIGTRGSSRRITTFDLSLCMIKPTKCPVRPAKTRISMGIHPVWSESSLSAWRIIRSLATHNTHNEDFDQTERIFAGRTSILLVLSCCSFLVLLSGWSLIGTFSHELAQLNCFPTFQ